MIPVNKESITFIISIAGKIYFIPKPENTPSGTATLPIMLSEELHRISGVNNPEQVKSYTLCFSLISSKHIIYRERINTKWARTISKLDISTRVK